MSYYAGRWARAQTLVLDRDSVALAVLKELADDYRDDQGACRIDSYKKLALAVGLKKPDTASAAVSRLQSLGLIKAEKIYSHVTGQILGTRFSLVGYVKAEWPESRQGQLVWVETAIQKGLTPQKWWPQKTVTTRETDITQKKDVPHETDVPRQTGDGSPSNGERYPSERGEGTPSNGDPLQGLTGNTQEVTGIASPASASASEPSLFPEVDQPKPKKTSRRKPSTPCPWDEGASIPEELAKWSAENYPTIDAVEQFRKFVGWALSKDMRYARWDQAFRNWMGNALKYQSQRGGYGSSGYRSKRQPTCPGDW